MKSEKLRNLIISELQKDSAQEELSPKGLEKLTDFLKTRFIKEHRRQEIIYVNPNSYEYEDGIKARLDMGQVFILRKYVKSVVNFLKQNDFGVSIVLRKDELGVSYICVSLYHDFEKHELTDNIY